MHLSGISGSQWSALTIAKPCKFALASSGDLRVDSRSSPTLEGGPAVFAALVLALAAPVPPAPDYQKLADAAEWKWNDKTATLVHSASLKQPAYEVKAEPKARYEVRVTFAKDGKERFTLGAHEHTVFRVVGDTLVYASFHPSANGATMIAVDLKTGKELWKTSLKGIGLVSHFAYRNYLNMEADADTITVFGNESFGKYVEILDTKTGKTVGHKKFPKDPEPKPE
jgi:outer membrane protein assembly factor BamB